MASPVRPKVSSATITSVADSASTVTLAASNSGRTYLSIYNNSSEILYVKLGSAASTSDFSFVLAANGGYRELNTSNSCYTGIVTGIWANNSTGAALVTEF